jgi:hypothetical protein
VRLPVVVMHTTAFTEPLRDYAGPLHVEGAFAGPVVGRREADRTRWCVWFNPSIAHHSLCSSNVVYRPTKWWS